MKHRLRIIVVCICPLIAALDANAALLSTFSFNSDTTDCISEASSDCTDINAHGLSGVFTVDLSVLDASGNGSISWNNLLSFDATNSVSDWDESNLTDGGVLFTNGQITDFGIKALPDYSNGWDRLTDGGGESLTIAGFGISFSVPASSGAPSTPGEYCPETGEFLGSDGSCTGETVVVYTTGISADYLTPEISAVPVPAAAWLFGSGLIGLAGYTRRRKPETHL